MLDLIWMLLIGFFYDSTHSLFFGILWGTLAIFGIILILGLWLTIVAWFQDEKNAYLVRDLIAFVVIIVALFAMYHAYKG
jgi:hypothetical protein